MRRIVSVRSTFAQASTLLALLVLCTCFVHGQTSTSRADGTAEQKTARHFESIRKSPPQQLAFLLAMPKGGDLHNHLSGSVYAEKYIEWAAAKGLCVHQPSMTLAPSPCTPAAGDVPVSQALTDDVLYRQIINSWSMRFWEYSGQNGHDQFFDSFAKFSIATWGRTGEMLADAARRAARGRVSYLELMLTPDDGGKLNQILAKVDCKENFAPVVEKLKSNGMAEAVANGTKALKDAEAKKDELLQCGTPQAEPGCRVGIRYVYQVGRAGPLDKVFAQMVAAFELMKDAKSKVVALNLVQAEDGYQSMTNFGCQMEMLNFLRRTYPEGHITLHAGELAPGLVPPDGLTFHIRDSVTKGRAERIGHGVDIMHEDEPYELLRLMAERRIMIEVCLTSNDVILGVRKEQHPLATYMQYGVPVALATDDEGVSRSEMSREFLKAAEDHGLGYAQLKTMARNSLQHAFLPGASLWSDARKFTPVTQCAEDFRSRAPASPGCKQFRDGSEKAEMQWRLEEEFRAFESRY